MDWNPYLVGGGTRPDAISGLAPEFQNSLASLVSAAPPEIQQNLRVTSGYRSNDVQARLFADAVAKYGSESAARKWVAPPGNSKHNHGSAVDFSYLDPAAQEWVHANMADYGLHAPMEWEPWHIEPLGSRGGAAPAGMAPAPQPGNALASLNDPRLDMLAMMPRQQPTPYDFRMSDRNRIG